MRDGFTPKFIGNCDVPKKKPDACNDHIAEWFAFTCHEGEFQSGAGPGSGVNLGRPAADGEFDTRLARVLEPCHRRARLGDRAPCQHLEAAP